MAPGMHLCECDVKAGVGHYSDHLLVAQAVVNSTM